MLLSTGSFSVPAREARIVYLSCLSCVVILVVFFSYNLWPRVGLLSSEISDSHAKAKPELQVSFEPSVSIDDPDHNDSLSIFKGGTPLPKPAELSGLKYAIILPTYTKHIPLAIEFLQSFMCLCTDYREIDIHVIVSDSHEVEAFRDALNGLKSCGKRYSIFNTPASNINQPKPSINIVNLFDILSPAFHALTKGNITREDTSALLRARGKFQYQTVKKMTAAMELKYDWALWLDSEAIAVQPFSMRNVFDSYIRTPTIWRSRMANTDFMRMNIGGAANVLNRNIESFGQQYWNLESVEWMFEKAVIDDLVKYVENEHDQDFWTVWATKGSPFEVNLYNMHVQARKLETTDALFAKYLVIETEMEMEKFGFLGRSQAIIDTMLGTGLLERGYKLFQAPEIVPGFSSMLQKYGQQLFRIDELDIAPPEVIDKFLLETPINILCSGAPPVHAWWEKRKKSIG